MAHTVVKLHFTSVRPSLSARLRHAWLALLAARQDAATRRHLAVLDDRALSDIGISRAQAQFVAERPFWDVHR